MTTASRPRAGERRPPRPSVRERIRYLFDNSLSHGPLALIGWLGLVVLAIILVAALVGHFVLEGAEGGFLDDFWRSVARVLDPGDFAEEAGWPSRLVALVVALLGIFLGGSLIGLIATALDQRVGNISKGRSRVLESDHTLILGWSARLPAVVRELVIANENRHKPAIVVLAQRPVADMDDELRDRVGDTRNTRLVTRSGNPSRPADLELVNLRWARSVVVLAGAEGDAAVVKSILAVKSLDPDLTRSRVVAEFSSLGNARTVRTLTNGVVRTVNSDDVIAQVTAQACHQAGLSIVFQDLLDFAGDECYMAEVPELVGHTYHEALLSMPTSSVIGRLSPEGAVELNPPPDTTIRPGDQVIAISADDDTVTFGGFVDVVSPQATPGERSEGRSMRVLIVGWSTFGPTVVTELQEFLAPESRIEICVDEDLVAVERVRREHPDVTVTSYTGGPEDLVEIVGRRHLEQVIVLGYREALHTDEADARTLLTLVTLRRIWPSDAEPTVRIIAQLLDQTNAGLAGTTGVDDFIVSDALASLMLAQLSERPELQAVFDDLFDPDGAVIELQPAPAYVPDRPVTYRELVAAGASQAVSVIGWRREALGEIAINPAKDRKVHLGADDQVLLLGRRSR